jgi:hypothetical protein
MTNQNKCSANCATCKTDLVDLRGQKIHFISNWSRRCWKCEHDAPQREMKLQLLDPSTQLPLMLVSRFQLLPPDRIVLFQQLSRPIA